MNRESESNLCISSDFIQRQKKNIMTICQFQKSIGLRKVQMRPGLVHKDEDGELEKVDKVRVALGIFYKPKFHYPIAHTSMCRWGGADQPLATVHRQ
jgi:hypothetical protein